MLQTNNVTFRTPVFCNRGREPSPSSREYYKSDAAFNDNLRKEIEKARRQLKPEHYKIIMGLARENKTPSRTAMKKILKTGKEDVLYLARAALADAIALRLRRKHLYDRIRLFTTTERIFSNDSFLHTTPHERLRCKRTIAVKCALNSALRVAPRNEINVSFTDDPAAVTISMSEYRVHVPRHKWMDRGTTVDVTVPTSWLRRVGPIKSLTSAVGIGVTDGLFTLDAAPVESGVEGVTAFAATWVTQGRMQTDLRVVRGFIAQIEGRDGCCHASFHGETLKKAVAGVLRKMRAQPTVSSSAERITKEMKSADRRFGDVPVTLADSEAVGNCDYGTRSWLHHVGIDPEAGSVMLTKVIAGYFMRPQREALAVIRHVVRRVRKAHVSACPGVIAW